MNGTHPHSLRMAVVAVSALAYCAGCQTHPTAMTNPFVSPDRVPPPTTRTLLPGQAAPYYQGDPLPAMRGAAQPAPTGVQLAQAEVPQGEAEEVTAKPSKEESSQPAERMAAANESAMGIPTDDEPLRFPPPQPKPPQPASPTAQVAQSSAAAGVSPALYTASATPNGSSNVQAAGIGVAGGATADPATNKLWRSPEVSSPSAATTAGLAPVAQTQPSAGPPAQGMGVRMRAVESPAQPGDSPTPRIRIPGQTPPPKAETSVEQAANSSPSANASVAAYYPPSAMPAQPRLQAANSAPFTSAPTPTPILVVASRDGFRPRTSVR